MDAKKGLILVIINSIIAIIIFSYLVGVHYKEDKESFCDISTGVSCDIVNKSAYSEIFGIPVALFGALTFLLIGILSFIALKNRPIKISKKSFAQKDILKLLLAILVFSVLFSLWLIYAELYLILSICILCVISDIIILITLFILIKLNEKSINKNIINSVKVIAIITTLIIVYLLFKISMEVF